MNRISLLLATAAIAVPMSFAQAADAYDPVYDWSGFYFGVQGGYAWGDSRATDILATNNSPWNQEGDQFTAKGEGFAIGLQGGYNWQFDSIVIGLEKDFNFLDVGDKGTSSISNDTHVESDGGFLSTARVRAGFAADRILIFGTGGLAFGDMQANVYDDVPVGDLTTGETGWQLGWAAGAGVEYAWSDSMSVKTEYLHYDLGSEKVGGDIGGGVTQFFKIKNKGDIVRVGLNWQF